MSKKVGHESKVKLMSSETSKNTIRIVEAAMMLFRRDGYETVSVRDICEAAGVPRSSFYTVFSGKADILAYRLRRVKQDFEKSLPNFIREPNDFERIWFLTDAFLKEAENSGPELTKAIFLIELEQSCGMFDLLTAFNDWLVQLLANCQTAKIVKNPGKPEDLIPVQLNLAIAVLFDWTRKNGSFPLRQTVRETIEMFLDVLPEYRWCNKKANI